MGGGDERAEPRKEGKNPPEECGCSRGRRAGEVWETAGVRFRQSRPGDVPRGQGRQSKPGERRAAAPRRPERTLRRRPHRPSTGPGLGSDQEQPGEGPERTRENKKGTTRRRRPLPAWPVGKRDGGRGRGCREPGETKTVGGLPLARFGLPHRLSDRGARCPTGRRLPYPGQHHPASGPLTSPSQQPQPPPRRSRFVTAARRLAQRGPRACALPLVPREPGPAGATCDQQVPGRMAPPLAFSHLPLLLHLSCSMLELSQ